MVKYFKLDRSQAKRQERPIFSGTVYQQPLVAASDSDQLTFTAVWFENGARTRPHVHATDQVLHVVEGTCVVADAEARRELGVGGVAFVKQGEWHWHGATKGGNGCHISIRKEGDTSIDVEERDWANW
jgi:quercetin dioxygenase-like cupin family protein